MKATELRIGNLIMSGNNGLFDTDGAIGKVLEIGNIEREFEQIYCECEESFDWFFKDNYFGIPLTEEWLEKFGIDFSIEKEWHQLTFTIKGLLFETASSMEGFTYNLCFDNMINIKYVHQLQNLYFALTGEELTIKQ